MTCLKIICNVHLWRQRHQTITTNTKTQQPRLWMFVFDIHQPTYSCSFAGRVHHVGGCDCPKLMHKSKFTEILVTWWSLSKCQLELFFLTRWIVVDIHESCVMFLLCNKYYVKILSNLWPLIWTHSLDSMLIVECSSKTFYLCLV